VAGAEKQVVRYILMETSSMRAGYPQPLLYEVNLSSSVDHFIGKLGEKR